MQAGRPSWKEMYTLRREVRRRFPDPFALPLVKRPEGLIASHLKPGARGVDVGAGDASLGEKLRGERADVAYLSVDPGGGADFTSLREADGTFDAAFLLEVVEHIDPDEAVDLLREVHGRLNPGGLLFLSTPNVFKPGQYLRDATHKTPYAWDELGALCIASGFALASLHRVFNAPALSRFLHLTLTWPLHRFLGVDCARSVMAVWRRG
ncbi:MAG: class I SAM-dependent methyltransferase [Planctomycetota bacterium]